MLRRSKNGKQGLEIYAENFFISFVLSLSPLRPCTSVRPACPFLFALNSIQCSFLGGRVGGGLVSAGRIKGSSAPHTFLCQSVLTRTARDWGGKYSRMVVKLILSIFALLFEFFLPRGEKGRGKMGNEAVKFSDVGEKGAKKVNPLLSSIFQSSVQLSLSRWRPPCPVSGTLLLLLLMVEGPLKGFLLLPSPPNIRSVKSRKEKETPRRGKGRTKLNILTCDPPLFFPFF